MKYELAQAKKKLLEKKGREKIKEAGGIGGTISRKNGESKPLSTIDKPLSTAPAFSTTKTKPKVEAKVKLTINQ